MDDVQEFAPKPKENEAWDVVIIGSGPASLTAAIYTTRGAASTLIIGGEKWGGQLTLTTKVDNFPGFTEGIDGSELIFNMRKQAERFGALFVEKTVSNVDFSKQPFEVSAGDTTYKAKSIIIATGADTRWLGVPGEKELIGKGVSSCAPCDAPFFKDKRVAVVGGGDSAMEEALVLAKYATEVTVIHRRDALKASAAMQSRAFENKKIRFLWDSEITQMNGDGKLESLSIKTKLGSDQAKKLSDETVFTNYSGSEKKENGDALEWKMGIDGVFIAIGHIPTTELFKDKITTDEKGYIEKKTETKEGIVPESQPHSETNIPGVFVAGDVHDRSYRQAITAAAFGCMAGMDVLRYLDKDAPSW